MDFKTATDELIAGCSLNDVAEFLGVSASAVKQARLAPGIAGHRNPPPNWQYAVLLLANAQVRRNRAIIRALKQKRNRADRIVRPRKVKEGRKLGREQ